MTTYRLLKVLTSKKETSETDSEGRYIVDSISESIYTPVLTALEGKSKWQNMYYNIITNASVIKRVDWEDAQKFIYIISHDVFVEYALNEELYTGLTNAQKLDVLNVLIEEGNTKYVLKDITPAVTPTEAP